MSVQVCPECRHPVAPKSPQCPNCGFRYPTARPDAKPNLPLVSATSPGLPGVRCTECGTELRGRMDVCPACGARYPLRRPFPWRAVTTIATAAVLLVAGWWLYQQYVRMGDREAAFVNAEPPPQSQVPHVKAYGFPARCADPAPVYIFEAGTVPGAFIVIVGAGSGDPAKTTKALADKYELKTTGYDAARQGFPAALSPMLVARLRCEPAVESLQEDPATRFNRGAKRQ